MRAYLDSLKAAGDLHVVSREVDPAHELAAVTAAFQKRHDGAILFEKVRGAAMPAVSNVYGSRRRLCALIDAPDLSFCPAWSRLMELATERADLQEVPGNRRRIALSDLPQPVYFAKDAGPYRDAGAGISNARQSCITPGPIACPEKQAPAPPETPVPGVFSVHVSGRLSGQE